MEIGVVIRTLNEGEFIARCIETLRAQKPQVELDILVVDSGSTDNTVTTAQAHGARLYHMDPEDFDYSKSLNVGIEEVRGELIVLLSAHAIPLGHDWLAAMTAPFEDEQVAGVASGQVPWPDAQWYELHRLAGAFHERREAYTRDHADGIIFSNAASCIRRSVWSELPFTLPAAEDLDWAQRAVAAGWTVVYEPAATVYHSHNESPRARALRMIDINRAGVTARRTRLRTLREAAALLYHQVRTIASLDRPLRQKARFLPDVLQMAYYYAADFNAPGSTAERRG